MDLSRAGEEEQLLYMDLSARRLCLLRSQKWTDVEFHVGATKNVIKAHRLILANASPVFEAMMYGPLAERNSPICVPDVAPEIFNLMLEFIYTDRIESFTLELLPEVNYVSKKYLIPRIMETLTNELVKSLDVENVVMYYEYAASVEYQPLIDKCEKIFSSQTLEVLDDKNILHANIETIRFIFSLNELAIKSELDLFKFIQTYAIANEIEIDTHGQMEGDEHHILLRPALQQIRFLSFKLEDFTEHYQLLRTFLSEQDILLLLLNVAKEKSAPVPEGFSTNRVKRGELQDPSLEEEEEHEEENQDNEEENQGDEEESQEDEEESQEDEEENQEDEEENQGNEEVVNAQVKKSLRTRFVLYAHVIRFILFALMTNLVFMLTFYFRRRPWIMDIRIRLHRTGMKQYEALQKELPGVLKPWSKSR